MKILFLLEDYNYFYTKESTKLFKKNRNYNEVLDELIARKYYQSDSMAAGFRALGYDTKICIPEANPMQLQWVKENNIKLYIKWLFQRPLRSYRSRIKKQFRTSYNTIQFEVLVAQVKEYKPTVIYFYSNIFVNASQVNILKKYAKKVVLQWSCPIWEQQPDFSYKVFDLIITAALQLKDYFNEKKYPSIYVQQAFDHRIINALEKKPLIKKGDVVFIGSFSLGHNHRYEVLENILKNNIQLDIYGIGKENLPKESLVYKRIQNPLFGMDMYNMYREYKIAIHVMGTGIENDGIAWNKYAGAKRLFEITGSGTLLLTSFQENVKDLFEIDKEVVTFVNPEELLLKINGLLKDYKKIEAIAEAGMKRTLKDHSFLARAQELEPILFAK